MKPTEITMQIVKNLGNYEAVRLEATFVLTENDDLTQCFTEAKQKLENAYARCYGLKPKLTTKSKEFDRICKALSENKTDIEDLRKYFNVADDALNYFKEMKLI